MLQTEFVAGFHLLLTERTDTDLVVESRHGPHLLVAVEGLGLYPLRQFLALLGIALGLGCFALREQRTTLPCRALDGQTRELRARVLEYPQESGSYSTVLLRLESEEGVATEKLIIR